MTFKQFSQIAHDWNLSTHFFEQMRLALTGAGNGVVKLNPNLITKVDMRFMEYYGYILNVNTNTIEV